VDLITACQFILLLSIDSYSILNKAIFSHSVLEDFHTELDLWLSSLFIINCILRLLSRDLFDGSVLSF
jgi:hypothetical protein